MKKIFALAVLAAVYTTGSAQTKPAVTKPKTAVAPQKAPVKTPAKPAAAAEPQFKSSIDSVSYAFGASIGNDIKSRGVENLNTAQISKGISDAFGGKALLSPEKSQELIYNFLRGLEAKKFEANLAEGTKFLAENAKKPGIVTLPSGLQYEVISQGTGAKPKAEDEVTVHYKGTLLDGKQFDSSYDRGEPATFVLNRVIAGWTEGLQLMPAGSKYRLFIPHNLAYGEQAAGPDIKPYSTLVFEVELISVKAN